MRRKIKELADCHRKIKANTFLRCKAVASICTIKYCIRISKREHSIHRECYGREFNVTIDSESK